MAVAICNKTVTFCNKQPDAFCNKLLLHFVIKQLSHFVIKYDNEPNLKPKPLLTHKIRFTSLKLDL